MTPWALWLSSAGIYLPLFVPGLVLVLLALQPGRRLPGSLRWALAICGSIFLLGASGCREAQARRRLAPNCVPCRREPPYRNCVPSTCAIYPGGLLCCAGGKKNLPEPVRRRK